MIHMPQRLESGEIAELRKQASKLLPLAVLAKKAAEVAEEGFSVFPARAVNGTKKPCTDNGFHDATDHPAKAYDLFMAHAKRKPTLIGVPTGVNNMIVGIDVDPDGLQWLWRNFNRLNDTRIHMTPRGGQHIVYKLPGPPKPIIGCRQRVNGQRL